MPTSRIASLTLVAVAAAFLPISCGESDTVATIDTSHDGGLLSGAAEGQCGDGLDSDNDGFVDDGCPCTPGETTGCFPGPASARGQGACGDGTMKCPGRGEFSTWTGECSGATLPDDEVCNGIDDDCDGAVDEGCDCTQAGETRACGETTGLGLPCKQGQQTCEAGGHWSTCEGFVPPEAEVCGDEVDNDCNGKVDDGCVPDAGTPEGGAPEGGTDSSPPDSATCTADVANDPLNCGSCGHDCCGGACVSGVCQARVLVDQTLAASTLFAVDDTSVYWDDLGLKKVAKTGGSPVTLLAAPSSSPFRALGGGLTVDATLVYFLDSEGLKSMPKDGGAATLLAATVGGGLTADASHLYWIQSGAGFGGPYSIMSMAKTGGSPSVLYGPFGAADNCTTSDCLLSGSLSVDGTSIYWSTVAAPLANDEQANTKSRVLKLPKTGGTPVTLRTGEPAHLLLDGDSLYLDAMQVSTSSFTYLGLNRLLRMSVNGGTATTILDPFSMLESPSPLIGVDDTNLYYVDPFGDLSDAADKIVRLPKDGGPKVSLVTTARPFAFGTDDKCIYWLGFLGNSPLYVVAK